MEWEDSLKAVRTQIGYAVAGKRVASVAAAGATNWFWSSPTDVASALAVGAYWLAVGARLGYPGLVAPARALYDEAKSAWKWTSSGSATAIRTTLDRAVSALDAVGGTKDLRLAPIYRVFGIIRDPTGVERAQARATEASLTGQLVGAAKASAADVTKGLETTGRLITDKKPPGTPDWLWWIQRNGFWLAVAGGVGLVGYVYLSPILAPLGRVRQAATLAHNPRRRRRSR